MEEAAQLENGSGEVLIIARLPALVKCVPAATVPPMVTTPQEAQTIENQLRNGMGDDLINQYIAQARQDLGVTVNQRALQQATGSGEF